MKTDTGNRNESRSAIFYLDAAQLLDGDPPPPLHPGGPSLVLIGCVHSEESRDFPREITAKEKY